MALQTTLASTNRITHVNGLRALDGALPKLPDSRSSHTFARTLARNHSRVRGQVRTHIPSCWSSFSRRPGYDDIVVDRRARQISMRVPLCVISLARCSHHSSLNVPLFLRIFGRGFCSISETFWTSGSVQRWYTLSTIPGILLSYCDCVHVHLTLE